MDTTEKIITIIKEIKQVSEFDTESTLITNGFMDSFDLMNFVGKIEEEFKITVNGDEVDPDNFDKITSLVEFVNKKLA